MSDEDFNYEPEVEDKVKEFICPECGSKESGEQRLSYVSFVTPLIQSVKELTDEIRFLRGAITGSTDLNQLKSLISSSQFV